MPRCVLCRLTALVLFAVCLPCPAPSADGDAPADARQHVPHALVRITGPDANHPAEVAVAIDPTNIQHIVAVSHQKGREKQPTSNYAYISWDGGRTWLSAATPNPDKRAQGDDAITFGPDGTAYHAYLSALGYGQKQPARANSGLFVHSLRGAGQDEIAVPVVDHVNSVEPMEDKPWL